MGDLVAHLSGVPMPMPLSSSGSSEEAMSLQQDEQLQEAVETESGPSEKEKAEEVQHSARKGLTAHVQHVMGLALTEESKHPMVVLDAADRLDHVMQLLTGGTAGVHRALVRGKGWWRILSQWDVIVYLANEAIAGTLGSVTGGTLAELGLDSRKSVLTLSSGMTAAAGFKLLAECGVSAMPITNEHGQLIGTLSTSDLRGMSSDKLKSLSLPVMDFLRVANLLVRPQVTAVSTDTLGTVLMRLVGREVHRVWLIDSLEHRHVVGVLSLTDILAQFVKWALQPDSDPSSASSSSSSTKEASKPPPPGCYSASHPHNFAP